MNKDHQKENSELDRKANIPTDPSQLPGQHFFEIFGMVSDYLFILDQEGQIIFCNPQIYERLGFTEKELKGTPWMNLFAPEHSQELKYYFKQIPPGEERNCVHPLISKTGVHISMDIQVKRVNWPDLNGYLAVCREVKSTKRHSECLEMALLATDAGLWDWNVQTGEVIFAEKWCEIRDYNPGEVKQHADFWVENIHPEDRDRTLQALSDHLQGKTPIFKSEYRVKTKGENYIWILDSGKVVEYDLSGEPIRVTGLNMNINQYKENELSLQTNLYQQELLSDIAMDLNSLDDFSTRIRTALQRIGTITKVSRIYISEYKSEGKGVGPTYEWMDEKFKPVFNTGKENTYHTKPLFEETLRKEGRFFSQNMASYTSDPGQVSENSQIHAVIAFSLRVQEKSIGVIGFEDCRVGIKWSRSELELFRSISGIIQLFYERMMAEQKILESEVLNRAILESIPDMIFQFHQNGTILGYRSNASEELAMDPEMFLNKNITSIFPRDFSDQVCENIRICLAIGSCRFDYQLPVKGILNDYEARFARMNDKEVIAIIRNVSERKEYERNITQERDRANLANRAKSEFLANMSHEIRTPMNAIIGFSEALYHKLEGSQNKKMIKSILNSGNLLMTLLNDILDLSKIEAGMLDISCQPVDLISIVKEIRLLFLAKAEKKNIGINVLYASSFPELLLLDEIRVKQVVFNILGNAIKFTQQGSVTIRIHYDISDDKNGLLSIEIEDTGIGIPLEEQHVIFEPFRQQQGAINRSYEGVGLGLAISRRLVEKMNGSIQLKSTPGKGSSFKILLPETERLSVGINREMKDTEVVDILFDPVEIMVVDDNPTNMEVLEQMLKTSGLSLIKAGSGAKALIMLKEKVPALILLDLRMPKMNGYEVAERIRLQPRLQKIPIIAYTAYAFGNNEPVPSGLFQGTLYKPASRDQMNRELMRHLGFKIIPKPTLKEETEELHLNTFKGTEPEWIQLYDLLVMKLLPKWETIKDQLILFKIEEFAQEVEQIARQFEFPYLLEYGKKLKEDLELFELESLQETMRRFPKIVMELSNRIPD